MESTQPLTPQNLYRGDTAAPSQPAGRTAATPTAKQLQRRDQRLEKLAEVTRFKHGGMSTMAAVSEARIGFTTFWRWRKSYALHGPDGLLPRISRGRRPEIDARIFGGELVVELQRLATRLGGSRAACRVFAKDPACPEPLRDYIRKRDAIPDTLRRLIGYRRCTGTIRRAGNFFYVEHIGQEQVAA